MNRKIKVTLQKLTMDPKEMDKIEDVMIVCCSDCARVWAVGNQIGRQIVIRAELIEFPCDEDCGCK